MTNTFLNYFFEELENEKNADEDTSSSSEAGTNQSENDALLNATNTIPTVPLYYSKKEQRVHAAAAASQRNQSLKKKLSARRILQQEKPSEAASSKANELLKSASTSAVMVEQTAVTPLAA